jgi:hypothetical protein
VGKHKAGLAASAGQQGPGTSSSGAASLVSSDRPSVTGTGPRTANTPPQVTIGGGIAPDRSGKHRSIP